MKPESNQEKLQRYRNALEAFVDRLKNDRYILAAVLVGSLNEETIWERESIWLWLIEADSVSRRLRSDGNDERIFRILEEENVTIHAEVIPRSRFRMMVEGASRTAFSCNFFAHRSIVYCQDDSIKQWFDSANQVASKDQDRELVTFSSWTIHAVRHARKRLMLRKDMQLVFQEVLHAAHSVAYLEIIRSGQIWEGDPILRAMQLSPELFQVIYLDALQHSQDEKVLLAAIDEIDAYLVANSKRLLAPLFSYLKKEDRCVPLSEISDHFAYSEVYPWHIQSACDWMERNGFVEKLSAPFKLTKKSPSDVEEPSYGLKNL